QRWLLAHGAQLRLAERAHVERHPRGGWAVAGQRFDDAILATQPTEAARLVRESGVPAADWLARADALAFEAIATVYATGGPRLPLPMLALPSGEGAPAQFVFDRGQLGGPPGLLAFVVSASHADKDTLEREVIAQAAGLGWKLQPLKTIVEKRATFACVPGLRRPAVAIAPGLWACGDYVEGPYPATLEGAVRAGLAVAERLGS
ncbi:hypothetical protein, partial [Arenimonas sp.]|uniref:hypothetical protein n=1 Tax=Arenimonas sp. TaxID=1872635 RepID=UPI002E336742